MGSSKLDKVSGFFFFCGFMLAKLQYLPFPLLSVSLRFVSLGFYLAAYATWFTSNLIKKDHHNKIDKWYGFAQFNEQLILAATIGFAATVLTLAAIFVPVLFIPAVWLFVIGNTFWAIGERHKLHNPPTKESSFEQQSAYLSYSIAATSISLVTAIAATLIFLLPLYAIPITICSLTICIGLGAMAAEYWLEAFFGNHKPLKSDSYIEMQVLNVEKNPENKPQPAPYHGPNPLHSFRSKSGSDLEKTDSPEQVEAPKDDIEDSLTFSSTL